MATTIISSKSSKGSNQRREWEGGCIYAKYLRMYVECRVYRMEIFYFVSFDFRFLVFCPLYCCYCYYFTSQKQEKRRKKRETALKYQQKKKKRVACNERKASLHKNVFQKH